MDKKAPPGVFDILPNDPKEQWRNSHLWQWVENKMRQVASSYGYQEIRTPIFEKTELFQRSVGESTDIVSKEMYTFQDKGGRSLTLRPEGTASVARAYIEHHLGHDLSLHKFYYIGPMFRYERAQAGRYRQHHQLGVEAIGEASPMQDVEMIDMLYTIYTGLGLKDLTVMVNSIGDLECRMNYKTALKNYLEAYEADLSEDSKRRLKTNPLRILDSKDPKDIAIISKAPSILEFLNEECKEHFAEVLKGLNALQIPYEINDKIVRGLDYYNRTVYEITAKELGSQNSVGGGGRYDGLIRSLGGQDVPATGFATGIERVIQTMIGQKVALPENYAPTLFLIPLGQDAIIPAFKILKDVRQKGIYAQMDFSGRKLAKIMSYASAIGAKFVAVIGEKELETKQVELKNMATGEKILAPLFHLSRMLEIETRSKDFIDIWKEMNAPFDEPLEAQFFLKKVSESIENTKHLTDELQTVMMKMQEII